METVRTFIQITSLRNKCWEQKHTQYRTRITVSHEPILHSETHTHIEWVSEGRISELRNRRLKLTFYRKIKIDIFSILEFLEFWSKMKICSEDQNSKKAKTIFLIFCKLSSNINFLLIFRWISIFCKNVNFDFLKFDLVIIMLDCIKLTFSRAVEHKPNNCHLITQVKQPNQLAHFSFYSFRVWTWLRFLVVFHPGSGRFKQTASGDEVNAFRERVFVRPFVIVGTTIRHCSCTAQSGLEWLICWFKN